MKPVIDSFFIFPEANSKIFLIWERFSWDRRQRRKISRKTVAKFTLYTKDGLKRSTAEVSRYLLKYCAPKKLTGDI